MFEQLRRDVCELNLELPRQGLVVWTSGNLSGRMPGGDAVAIKPTGIQYRDLTPDHIVVVDLDGRVLWGDYKPSTDTATHLYIYRHRSDVNGVVHTHSAYATAWAAVGRPIPVYLTSAADNFGGPVPCGNYAVIGEEAIGREVVDGIGDSPAMLLKNHGVLTIGDTPEHALRAAVMVEEVARTAAIALALGTPSEIPQEEVTRQRTFYLTSYGQPQGAR
jgi:L-ribulose-5-phosphate 4-epimerase